MLKPQAIGAALGVIAWAAAAGAQVAPVAPATLPVGDWQIAPVLDVRVRGEYRHDLDAVDRGVVVEHARLGLDATHGPVEARLVLQDARVLDLTVGDSFVEGPVDLALTSAYEAWGEVHTSSTHPSFVRVGRQTVTWGEGRLLGSDPWSASGRSLDAVRGRLILGDGAVEALAAIVEAPMQTAFETDAFAACFGVRGEYAFDPLFQAEAYGLARLAYDNPPALSLDGSVQGQTLTASGRLHGERLGWRWGVEGAYQFGHVGRVTRAGGTSFTGRRSAWAAAGHVSYTFEDAALSPAVGLGASYASGDRRGSTYGAFDPILPDSHTWHGAMDLFAWSNEEEASAHLSIVPWTDGLVALEYRYARLAEPADAWRTSYLVTIGEVANNTKGELGHEVDAKIRWSPWVPVTLEGGYSLFVVGPGARAILDATRPTGAAYVSHFAYLQAQVTF